MDSTDVLFTLMAAAPRQFWIKIIHSALEIGVLFPAEALPQSFGEALQEFFGELAFRPTL